MAARKKTARLSSRKNVKRRGRFIKRFAALVLLAAMAFGGNYFLMHSSFFELREVVIDGNKFVSDRELKDLMGIDEGENIFRLPSAEVARMGLSSKWVRSISVRKEFPHKLVIKLTEAVPTALLQVRKDVYFVDDRGVVLEKLEDAPVTFLPVIVSNSARNPVTFGEAVKLAGVLKEKGIAAREKRIEITGVEKNPEDLTMSMDGMRVKVGSGKYEEKLRRFFELSGEIRKRHVSVKFVDLRFSNGVVVKPFKEMMK